MSCGARRLLVIALLCVPVEAAAQTVSAGQALQTLIAPHVTLGEEFQSVLHVIQRQITTFPTGSSSGAFVYTFDPNIGLPVRRTTSFGPMFVERPLTTGRRKLSVNVASQQTSWQTLAGVSLHDGLTTEWVTIPTTQDRDTLAQFGVVADLHATAERVTSTMRFTTTRTVIGATYGVNDRIDVGVLVPYGRTSVSGSLRYTAFDYTAFASMTPSCRPGCADSDVHGSSSGLADMTVRGKFMLFSRGALDAAAGADIRLPTGDPERLLGTGSTALTGSFLGSVRTGRLTNHFSTGYSFVPAASFDLAKEVQRYIDEGLLPAEPLTDELNAKLARELFDLRRQPNEVDYSLGADVAATSSLTIAGDLIGRTLLKAGSITRSRDVLHASLVVEPNTLNLLLGAASAKLLVAKTWLLTASVAFPLNSNGIKPGITPVVGFERSF